MGTNLTEAPIRQLTPEMVKSAALLTASFATDVEDAKDLFAMLGIQRASIENEDNSSELSLAGGGTLGWNQHNAPKIRGDLSRR